MWSELILKPHYTARALQSGLGINENQDLHHKDKWSSKKNNLIPTKQQKQGL